MGISNRNRRLFFLLAGLVGALVTACVPTPTVPPATTGTTRPPDVLIQRGPDDVCGDAVQVRLQVQTSTNLPATTPAIWTLWSEQGDLLQEATWPLRDGPVLVNFPNSKPLPPGAYAITLQWQDFDLARHTFEVISAAPAITHIQVGRLPGESTAAGAAPGAAPGAAAFSPDTRHLYVTYGYEGGCPGAPYWLIVKDAANTPVCRHDGVLEAIAGSGSAPCYRDDGEPFEPGAYRVEFSMSETVTQTGTFTVEAPPVLPSPTPTPTRQPVRCGPLFTAAGLTSAGEPFLTQDLFDWYTQVIYVGSRCDNVPPATPWRSAWYRQRELVREAEGVYNGSPEGIVWDSLTGAAPTNPFLRSGTYTVSLQIGEMAPVTAEFRVFGYQSDTQETP